MVDQSTSHYEARQRKQRRDRAVQRFAERFHQNVVVNANPTITEDAGQTGAFVEVTLWVPYDYLTPADYDNE